MNPLGAVLILLACIIVLSVESRRYAALALVGGAMFIAQGQAIQLAGCSIFSTRILEIAGLFRVLKRGELSLPKLNRVDWAVIVLYGYTALVFDLRSSVELFNRTAVSFDSIICYFIFRALVRSADDLVWFVRSLIVLLVPYVSLVLVERHTGRTVWAPMGGFGESWLREGAPRCQGSFRHPSLLGTLGASFFPLYIGMIFIVSGKKWPWFAILLCLTIIWATNSGGPLNFAAFGILGWLCWKIRTKMKVVRRLLVALFIVLALTMKAPVWFVLARASDITGGDGWHRSELIDQAVHALPEWWADGLDIASKTQNWFPYEVRPDGGADITNQYLAFALDSGVAGLVLFIAMLTFTFSSLGRAMAAVRSGPQSLKKREYLLWALGVMLAGHAVNWLGITYFDQTYLIWFMQLAAIVGICEETMILCHSAEEVVPVRHQPA